MGSGKSRVGRLLARQHGLPFVDTDKLVEQMVGQKIADIFAEYGEEEFRRLEHLAILEACSGERSVIATGGGVVETRANLRVLKEQGVVFFLNVPIPVLAERLKSDTKRPLLKGKNIEDVLRKLMERRGKHYRKAHHIIRVGASPAPYVASMIWRLYERSETAG